MPERKLYAAIDLGSNSFHMVVARHEHGELRIIDRLKDMVRLAGGLDEHGKLDPQVRENALSSLARFGQRIRGIPESHLRAVGTQTFRRLRNPASFLVVAETALGCPIDIISGREEARLVYLGVGQGTAPSGGRRLVVDIGGGSTEIVVGDALESELAESLPYGCVSLSRSAFPGGRISPQNWQRAGHEIRGELLEYGARFRASGWNQAVGSSGTVRAVANIIQAQDPASASDLICRPGLQRVKSMLLEAGHVDRIQVEGLSERRRPVIAGGVVILEAVMDALRIDQLEVSPFALREGLLHNLLGRLAHRDPRDQTVQSMAERYQTDSAQAARVGDWTMTAFEQVAEDWRLDPIHAELLHWICQLHEIGLTIAHEAYPLHTAYILDNADMPGFSRQEQQFMAAICRLQRGRIAPAALDALPARLHKPARRVLALLRLGIALCRARSDTSTPDFALSANEHKLRLKLPEGWLEANPLTRRDLDFEKQQLRRLGLELKLKSLSPVHHD